MPNETSRSKIQGARLSGDLLCRAPCEGGRPFAAARFAHLIPESRRRGPEGFFNSLLGLIVHLGREAAAPEQAATLQDAVREFFKDRAIATQRRLRQLLRRGRISLVIGVAFVAAAVVVGDIIASLFTREHLAVVLQESLAIGGWVAMWGPLDILLYEWWPVRAEVRLYDRLGAMVVEVVNPNPAAETAVMR